MRIRKGQVAAGAVGLALALALTSCATSPSPTDTEGANGVDEPVDITVGIIPAAELAALQVGIDQGFFEEEGLNVTTQVAAGTGALIPALVAGDLDFAWGSATSYIPGLVEGVPIQVVAPGSASGETVGLVVSGDSPVESVADLKGKPVGVVLVNSLADYLVRGTFEEAGLAGTDFQPLEIGFPDAFGALEAGRADAAMISEPFLTVALDAGARVIAWPFLDVNDGEPLVSADWITTTQFAEANQDVIERFARAIGKANAYASEHDDAAREAVSVLLSEADPDVLARMTLPRWPTEFDPDGYNVLVGLLENYGTLSDAPSAEEVYPED